MWAKACAAVSESVADPSHVVFFIRDATSVYIGMPILAGISFSESGKSAAIPPLLLIHGSGGSRLDWPPGLRELSGSHVTALDLPGHGDSSPPARDTVVDYATAVAGLLGALGIDKTILAGHSLGGAIALQVALSYPEKVHGLVLVGTGARLRVHPEIMDRILTDPADTAGLIASWAYAEAAPQTVRDATLSQLLRQDPSVVWGDYRACHHFDVMANLGAISVPSLVIVGRQDRMTPVKYSEYLARNIPDAELVVIENAGHMVTLEQPEPVRGAIAQWIRSH
jgi:pimeloyl-ACP methyl ester carboxylesterase